MRVSFDLDDLLICYHSSVPRESTRLPLLHRWLDEPLRQGTCALLAELKSCGCDVWICTSSSRSPLLIRLWLALYGVTVGRVITHEMYAAYLRRFPNSQPPSKNPQVFGIDLHIDDSEGVRQEGEQHGFDVLVIAPDEEDWTQRVAKEVKRRLRR